jgi:hypothetical protein
MMQRILIHQDKPKNAEVIREEQDAMELHKEIIERTKRTQKRKEERRKKRKIRRRRTQRRK